MNAHTIITFRNFDFNPNEPIQYTGNSKIAEE